MLMLIPIVLLLFAALTKLVYLEPTVARSRTSRCVVLEACAREVQLAVPGKSVWSSGLLFCW